MQSIWSCCRISEFQKSKKFPTTIRLQESKCNTGDHSTILLDNFKERLIECSRHDVAFRHRAESFTFYAPLLSLFDDCIHYGDGYAREIVYQLQLPIYARLHFPNYYTECFRHVINLLAKWPILTRLILRENCAVNLSGKRGKGIELDAYVESEVVKPLKRYASGHSTVLMCERIMGNLDLFRHIRSSYKHKEAFDIHSTSRHSVQSSFPDQVKEAWFCLHQKFFKDEKRKEVKSYPLSGNGQPSGKLPSDLLDIREKGKEHIIANFEKKLYESFHDLRYSMLMDMSK